MSATEATKNPRLGESVMVWPALRTVRNEDKTPVLKDGEPLKKQARVRAESGVLITSPIPVVITPYYAKLIGSGNLKFGSKADHQKKLVEAAQQSVKDRQSQAAVEKKPANKTKESSTAATA